VHLVGFIIRKTRCNFRVSKLSVNLLRVQARLIAKQTSHRALRPTFGLFNLTSYTEIDKRPSKCIDIIEDLLFMY